MPRIRPEGGLTGTYLTPTVATASGMWTMRDVDRNRRASSWPLDTGQADQYFNLNTLLIHADGSNNANNNTILDSSTDKIPFANTYSTYFDGTGDYVTVSSATAFDQDVDFTLEFWFNLQALPGSQDARFWSPTSVAGLGPGINSSGKIVVDNQSTGVVLTSTETFSLNTWYHFALVRNGPTTNNLTMYVNGVASNTISYSSWQSGMSSVTIGRRTDTSTDLNGYMSNLRWVRGNAIYTSNFTPSTTPLTAVANTQLLTFQSSTIVDNSPNAFTITQSGTPTVSSGNYPVALTRTSNPGQGTFSPYSQTGWSYNGGASDYATVSYNSALDMPGDFTVEAWINRSYNTQSFEIICGRWQAAATNIFQFYISSTGTVLSFALNNNASTATASYSFAFNTWYHVAAVRSGTTITLYINGVATGTPLTSITYDFTHASQPLAIGRNAGAQGTQNFNGNISNLRIVQRALYTSNFTPSTIPLTAVANTSVLTCAENRFMDESPNSILVTPSGSAAIIPISPFAPTTTYSTSSIGGSYSFNGSSDYFRAATALGALGLGTGDFTIEYWVYFNSIANGQQVDLRIVGGASQVKTSTFLTSSGVLSFVTSNTTRISHTVATGQWYHVAAVRSSGVTKFYLNGVANNTTYTDTNDYGTSSPLTIGTAGDNPGAASNFHNGYITDVRVTKRAIYTSNFTPSTTPLTAVANTTFLLSGTNAGIIDQTSKTSMSTGSGTRLSTTQSKFGGTSIFFNGTSDFLRVVHTATPTFNIGTGDFTIEFFVFFVALQGNIVDFRTGSANLVAPTIYVTSNTIRYYVSGVDRITSSTLNTNQWYHVAVVRSSGVTKLYIDGSQSGSNYTDTNAYISGSPYIGRSNDGTNTSFFSGYLDEIRFSQYARYTNTFTPPTQAFLDR